MEVIEKKDQLYILDDGRVREFLILGSEYAILIDTGFADSQVFETVKKITDLPVKVLLTHGDRDHAEGLEKFGECWAMEEDWSMIDSRIISDRRDRIYRRTGRGQHQPVLRGI